MSVPLIQTYLRKEGLEGWLLYAFQKTNPIFKKVLHIDPNINITRRIFYWIPKEGIPLKIVHKVESHLLDNLVGTKKIYTGKESLKTILSTLSGTIAMEISFDIPALSFVDGATLDYLREIAKVLVVSSKTLIQKLFSLSDAQISSHIEAATILEQVVFDAFTFLEAHLSKGKPLYELDVSAFILNRFSDLDCVTDHSPIVASGHHSSNPHYQIKKRGALIKQGDVVLIDLWCKKKKKEAIYADITRVCCIGSPKENVKEIFKIVREAQKKAVFYIKAHKNVRGCDVDTFCRTCLGEYLPFVLHRLGHSIDTNLHGYGANLDSFECLDTRYLLPNSCFSIEPALYFPGEFGIRLEHDAVLTKKGLEITGGVQDELVTIKSS